MLLPSEPHAKHASVVHGLPALQPIPNGSEGLGWVPIPDAAKFAYQRLSSLGL
jgi:hypothetical protein